MRLIELHALRVAGLLVLASLLASSVAIPTPRPVTYELRQYELQNGYSPYPTAPGASTLVRGNVPIISRPQLPSSNYRTYSDYMRFYQPSRVIRVTVTRFVVGVKDVARSCMGGFRSAFAL